MFRSRLRTRLGTSLKAPTFASPRRTLHRVPTLPEQDHFSQNGVPEFMSPAGFKLAWSDYMGLVTEKLNEMTAGTDLENKTPKTISFATAREPSQAAIFNWASMAHNHHFFFNGIASEPAPMSPELQGLLETSFSSIESLKEEFIHTAGAMFGPGFVWLVMTQTKKYRILPTYLAGSPYPLAHWRSQNLDMNTEGAGGSAKQQVEDQAFGKRNRGGVNLPPGGIELQPLLCLNTWDHCWLMDYGVGQGRRGGKMAYVEAWWDRIDWKKVEELSGLPQSGFKR